MTVGYARLRGSMGHLAALRSAIEFLFWDDWEMAVLGQILAGRSREVMGGYGRLRAVTEEENGGKWRTGRKKVGKKAKEKEGKSLNGGGKWRKMEELRSSTESSVRWGSEQDSLPGDEK